MWIRTQCGDLVNLEQAASVEVLDCSPEEYSLVATLPDGDAYHLWSGTREDCEGKQLMVAAFIEDALGHGLMTLGPISRPKPTGANGRAS